MYPFLLNLVSIFRRFKLTVVLNVLCLSVAFATFMIIMIQLDYDFGFDNYHKDKDKIFRLEFTWGESWQVMMTRPIAERFIESSPHIVAGALTSPSISNFSFYVENENGERDFFEEKSMDVSPDFFDVFTFDFVEGSKDSQISSEGGMVIPLSLSRKLFGNESAVGKQISGSYTVAAVYRDLPANSIINNCIYFTKNKDTWRSSNYIVYLRIDQELIAPLLFENFKRTCDCKAIFGEEFDWKISNIGIRLTNLPEIHFVTDVLWDNTPKVNKNTLLILFIIAIVIIVIASVNFTNFNTALIPMRIKSINTQRVLGAQQIKIRLFIVFESIFFFLFSYFIAIWLILAFKTTTLVNLINADLSLSNHSLIVVTTALIGLFAGFFVGLYPAYYMTSFEPSLILKGSFGLSLKGKKIRNTLIGFQFVASFILIIGASFMFLQNRFMQSSDFGFEKNGLITVDLRKIQRGYREVFVNKLKVHSGIEDVTLGEALLSSSDKYMEWGGQKYKDKKIDFQCLPVHYKFLKVMGIEITEGRDFRLEDTGTQYGAFVFNETARKSFEMEIGSIIEGNTQGEIIGFMPDIKFASFRTTVEPMAFYVWGTYNWGDRLNIAYIKTKADTDKNKILTYIHSTIAEFEPNFSFEVLFFDDVIKKLYEKESELSLLVSLFSLIAIFISIVGVFGLVVFESVCRRKEIGIRKIHGATTLSIIIMFNKVYFRILLFCFLMGSPLAWYAVNRWLENFAYKTPLHWWVYLLALFAVGIITVATVTFQTWSVANDNPVNSIKTE